MAIHGVARRLSLSIAAACAVLLTAASAQPDRDADVDAWLQSVVGFPAGDLAELALGRAVARNVETASVSESSAAGAVVINAPPDRLLREFERIETTRRGPGVLAIGAFNEPPSLADLAGVVLTAEDLTALRRCRPGDCGLKLPASAIEQFRSTVDWGTTAAAAQATAVMRSLLLARLAEYRSGGNAALGLADDKRPPLDLAEELSLVLAHEDWLPGLAPGVRAHLSDFPATRAPQVRDSFYWARVDFGMKPTIRLNHVSVHPTPGARLGLSHVIATKQIYASHYLRAALELRLVFPRSDGGFLLVMATRSRNDGMTGLLGFVVRTKVRGRSREGLARYLQNVKATIETGRRGEVVGAP